MATATKVGPKYQVTIPLEVRKATGLKIGDLVEATPGAKGTIVLRPKVQLLMEKVDWEELPASVKKRLKQAEADEKTGRVTGPFTQPEDLISSLRGTKKRRK